MRGEAGLSFDILKYMMNSSIVVNIDVMELLLHNAHVIQLFNVYIHNHIHENHREKNITKIEI